MKKTILATVLLSGLVLSVAAPAAYAAPEDTSRVEVELTKDGGHEPSPGPYKDKLTMVYVPTVFKFASEVTDGSLLLENQHAEKDSQFLAVNDDRKDTTTGQPTSSKWVVTGKLSELKTTDGTPLIAKLNLNPTKPQEYNIGSLKTVNGIEDYEALDVVPGAPEITGYSVTSVSLTAGGDAVPFFNKTVDEITAPKGAFTNLGYSTLAIATDHAKTKGTYNGTIDWVLAAQ